MIERLRVRIPAGAAREFSSSESTLCADSHSVFILPPSYRSGTQKTQVILPKAQVAGYTWTCIHPCPNKVGVSTLCRCAAIALEPIRKRAHTQLVREGYWRPALIQSLVVDWVQPTYLMKVCFLFIILILAFCLCVCFLLLLLFFSLLLSLKSGCQYVSDFIFWSTDGSTGIVTDLLTDWLPDWLTAWLPDCLTDSLTNWLTDKLTDWLTDWLTGWLTH